MTPAEFKQAFITEINRGAAFTAPGLSDYAISLYLTKGEHSTVEQYISGSPRNGESYEEFERKRRKLDHLKRKQTYDYTIDGIVVAGQMEDEANGRLYSIEDLRLARITDEYLLGVTGIPCYIDSDRLSVVPKTDDEKSSDRLNKHRDSSQWFAWRVDRGILNGFRSVEIISRYAYETYVLDYIRRPNPIVVGPLPSNRSVDGVTVTTPCELDELIHFDIVSRAASLYLKDIGDPRYQASILEEQKLE